MNEELRQRLFPRPMGLWVSLARNDAELARAAVAAGADVIKGHIAVEHRASGTRFGTLAEERERLQAIIAAAGGKPVGLVTGGSPEAAPESLEEVAALGISFVDMFDAHLPASWLDGRSPVPVIAAAGLDTPRELLADLVATGLAALEPAIVPGTSYGQRLTALDLAGYRYFRRQVSVPLIVPSQRRLLPADIPALRSAGIDAVMIGAVVTGLTADGIAAQTAAFRRAIDQS